MLRSVKQSKSLANYNFIKADDYCDYSDNEIIKKILDGNTFLFEVLVRRYNQRLFRIQRSYISDEEAVKDTLQQTYMKAFENLDSFRGEARFSTWITRIAINEALKYLNKENRYSDIHKSNSDNSIYQHSVDNKRTPQEDMIQRDLQDLLEEAVDKLPPKYRAVYVMREVEQISTKETADCLEISESNVKVRLHRAKKKVKNKLEEKVADTEIFNFRGKRCDLMVLRVMNCIDRQGKSY